jgi:hypothetical protein
MIVKVVKENGEIFETTESNLENVRRLIKYKDIIYPSEEGTEEEVEVKKVEPKISTPAAKGKGSKK